MIDRNVTSATLERYFEQIYDLMEESMGVPLSEKKIVDPDALFSILDELKSRIPKEIIRAEKTEEDRDNIIKGAYEDADRIVQQARDQAARIISDAEAQAEGLINQERIVKEANALAEELKTNALRHQEEVKAETLRYQDEVKAEADEFATQTKLEALQYVDNMLEFFENRFNEDLKTMATNRDSVLFEIQKINAILYITS